MVRNIENSDVRVVELGLGTTNISQIIKKGDTKSCGIVFNNDKDNVLNSNSVIIEIHNNKGVISYLLAMVEFLKTHADNDEGAAALQKVLEEINNIMKENR